MHQRVQLFVPDKKYYTESIFLRVVLPVRLDGMDERGRGVFRNTILRRRDTFSEIYTSPGWTLPPSPSDGTETILRQAHRLPSPHHRGRISSVSW